jgi:type II secretory pathway pseudopilin PulG
MVELAVVLVLISLLFNGLMAPLSARVDQSQHKKTEIVLNDAREALLGFAAAQGRIPCPSTAPLETEAKTDSGCTVSSGFLSGPTLGIPVEDAWGRPLRYAVAKEYLVKNPGNALPNCPPDGEAYAEYSATVKYEIDKAMPCLVTDLKACSNGTRNTAVVYGGGVNAACSAGWGNIAESLVVVVWSDGPDSTTTSDDLAVWPPLPSIAYRVAIAR